MSKITIEFQIPQDQEEFDDSINGAQWHRVVQDFDEMLRSISKEGDPAYKKANYREVAEKLRMELYEMVQSFRLQLD